jgi:hypothetical protein
MSDVTVAHDRDIDFIDIGLENGWLFVKNLLQY